MHTDNPFPIKVYPDKETLSRAVAEELVASIRESIEARANASIALAGGSTPRLLYTLLAGDDYGAGIPWPDLLLFWGDERYVPHNDEKSNYRMAKETLIDHVPVPEDQVFPIPTSATNPHDAANSYTITLRNRLAPCDGRFDIVLLGMGDDGHTASLFPGSPALDEDELMAVAAPAPVEPRQRITLTYPVLNAARHVHFLVSGANKAPALDCVLGRPSEVTECPARRVRPGSGTLTWWLDEAAAANIQQ